MLNQRYQAPHLLLPLWCNLCLHRTLLSDPEFNGKEILKEILIQGFNKKRDNPQY